MHGTSKTHRRNGGLALLGMMLCAGGNAHGDAAQDQLPAQETTAHKALEAQVWRSVEATPDLWEGTWQGVSDIYDSADQFKSAFYTPWALNYIKNYKPGEDTAFANCKPVGMPAAMWIVGLPMKFFYAPGMIALYLENDGAVRFIHMDGRKHSPTPNPSYLGESIGHWDANDLVVDTVGLNPDTMFQIGALDTGSPAGTSAGSPPPPLQGGGGPGPQPILGPHGPNLRIVERFHMKDFNTLRVTTTEYDDKVFTKPYIATTREYHRYVGVLNEPQEWECTDNRDRYDPETGRLSQDVKGDTN